MVLNDLCQKNISYIIKNYCYMSFFSLFFLDIIYKHNFKILVTQVFVLVRQCRDVIALYVYFDNEK